MKRLFYLLVIALLPNLCIAESVNLSDVKVWDSQGNLRGIVDASCSVDSLGFSISFWLPISSNTLDDEGMVSPVNELICFNFPKAKLIYAPDSMKETLKNVQIDGETIYDPKLILCTSSDDPSCVFGSLGYDEGLILMSNNSTFLVSIQMIDEEIFSDMITKAIKANVIIAETELLERYVPKIDEDLYKYILYQLFNP